MLELMTAKVNLNKTVLKMQLSLDDINKSHPHRKDLIDSMEESVYDLLQAQNLIHTLDLKMMSQSGELHRKDRLILELMSENKELKKFV